MKKYFRLVELCATSDNKEIIETESNAMDKMIFTVLIRAETKCTWMSSHHLDVWTPELMQAMKNKRHWWSKLTQAQKFPAKIEIVACLIKYQEVHKKFKKAEKKYNNLYGHRYHMRALRAESTHVLASIALVRRLAQFTCNNLITVPVYTDCETLINRTMANNINSPSLIMANHIDLIHEIRQIINTTNITFDLEYKQTIKMMASIW